MPSPLNLKRKRFGRLVVLRRGLPEERVKKRAGRPDAGRKFWICECDCGNKSQVITNALTSGATVSCGCYNHDLVTNLSTTHGFSKVHPREYASLLGATRRCHAPSDPGYSRYGARGISVCPEWRADPWRFLADVGPRPPGPYSLERLDVDGDYCATNCIWATPKQQARNRRCTIRIEYDGERVAASEVAEKLGLNYACFVARISAGWSLDRAISTPFRSPRK